MHNRQTITDAMMKLIAPSGQPLTDNQAVSENIARCLGEHGINPEDAIAVGTMMMMAASAAEESPEATVINAFVSGLAVGSILANPTRIIRP